MCSSRKYPYSPNRRDWNFLGGTWDPETPKNLKKGMELNKNFQKVWGSYEKNPSVWEVWIFFGNYTIYTLLLILTGKGWTLFY